MNDIYQGHKVIQIQIIPADDKNYPRIILLYGNGRVRELITKVTGSWQEVESSELNDLVQL